MARQVKDARLQTRTSRAKLAANPKPYFRELDPGLHLGYRKGKTGGRWVLRAYLGAGDYKTETLATADDNADADGVTVLDYGQAQALARQRAQELIAAHEGRRLGPYSVADALADYEKSLAREGRAGKETLRRLKHVREALGEHEVAKLKKGQIQDWLDDLASRPPLTRSGKPKKVDMSDPEVQRRRKDSANRYLTDLKAALNHAFNEGKAQTDAAWRTVKPFRAVGAARVRYLSTTEITRLLNACPSDLRDIVQGALLTGARAGDLREMRVGDFLPDAGAVLVGNRKGRHAGKTAFPAYLSPEGIQFFKHHTAGREPDELMFTRADGSPWNKDDLNRPIREANKAAKIDPPATFHILRHTYASHAVMAGVPLMVVAQNLGHSDTRMVEKHYGHLAPSYARDAIAKGLPTWGVTTNDKVTPIAGGA